MDKPMIDAHDTQKDALDTALSAGDTRSPTARPARRIGPQTLADAAR